MSNNIDTVKVLKLEVWMYAEDVERFRDRGYRRFPECSFLDTMQVEPRASSRTRIPLPNLHWCGNGSGNSLELFREIAGYIHGIAEGVMIYESGYTIGFRIVDGKYTRHEAVMALGEEIEEDSE